MGRRTKDVADALRLMLAYEVEVGKLKLPAKGPLVLSYLGRCQGETSLLQLRKELGLSSSLAKYVCDVLIAADLIDRLDRQGRGGTSLLRLTRHGRSTLGKLIGRTKKRAVKAGKLQSQTFEIAR